MRLRCRSLLGSIACGLSAMGQAFGFVVATYDPATDLLGSDFVGLVRVIERVPRSETGVIGPVMAVVQVEVVESLVGLERGAQFRLEYVNLAWESDGSLAEPGAVGEEEVLFLSGSDFAEYVVGAEYVVFCSREESGRWRTSGYGLHFAVVEGRIAKRLPKEYLAKCGLEENPPVQALFDGIRRVAPIFRLQSARPVFSTGAIQQESPSTAWERIWRRCTVAEGELRGHDLVYPEAVADFPWKAQEFRESLPTCEVWGEAVLDDVALILVSTPAGRMEKPEVQPLLLVRRGDAWALVCGDLTDALDEAKGPPLLDPAVARTLKYWAEREIAVIDQSAGNRQPWRASTTTKVESAR
jgi:hypothetical protein